MYGFVGNDGVDWVDFLGWDDYNPSVDACEGYLMIAHGNRKKPRNWNLNGVRAIAGFIGCWPGSNQPKDPYAKVRSYLNDKMDTPDSPVWPDVPTHNDTMLDGPLGRSIADAISDGTPEDERNFRVAIARAIDRISDVVDTLCKCCKSVTITIDVQDDATVRAAIEAVNKEKGTTFKAGKNVTSYTCK